MNLFNHQMDVNKKFLVLSVIILFVISDCSCLDDNSTNHENKFLKYIFNKYGSKGVITFEVRLALKKIKLINF